MNYAELSSAITDYADRNDVGVTGNVDTFLVLAESKINRKLRSGEMSQRSSLTVPADYTTPAYYPLPNDFGGMRSIKVGDTPLDYLPPTVADAKDITFNRYYLITGGQLQIIGDLNEGDIITMTYYQKVPNLNSTDSTNWLADGEPDIYLYGALAALELFVKNDERAAMWNTMFQDSLLEMTESDRRDRWSGTPMVATCVP